MQKQIQIQIQRENSQKPKLYKSKCLQKNMFKFFKEKLQNLLNLGKEKTEEAKLEEAKAEKKAEKAIKKEKQKVKSEKNKEQAKEVKEQNKKEKLKEEKETVKEAIEELKEEVEEIQEQEIRQEEQEIIIEKTPELPQPEIKKEEKVEKEEKKGFFARLQSKFNTVRLDQETFNEFFEKLELLLLENNVALEVVDKIRTDMEKKLLNIEIKKENLENEIRDSLKESILDVLIEPFDMLEKIKKKDGPFVILFFGINGSGKTTTIAKVANMLKDNKITTVLAAADTFRAAAIEQLKKHGDRLGIKVVHQNYGSDPAAVAFDAISYAKAHDIKVVLIDTAGRMHTKDNLLKEMDKIIRVTKPDLKIFVAESITGNDATEQAKAFNEIAHLDGSILTKADVDEKGGTAISIGHVTGKPILYLGTGQTYKDLQKFSPKEIIANLGLD